MPFATSMSAGTYLLLAWSPQLAGGLLADPFAPALHCNTMQCTALQKDRHDCNARTQTIVSTQQGTDHVTVRCPSPLRNRLCRKPRGFARTPPGTASGRAAWCRGAGTARPRRTRAPPATPTRPSAPSPTPSPPSSRTTTRECLSPTARSSPRCVPLLHWCPGTFVRLDAKSLSSSCCMVG